MSVVFLVVGFWYFGFVTRGCTKIEAQRMGAMMVLIFAALVFYTLYEQTYGSWVTFTDRLLTKARGPVAGGPRRHAVALVDRRAAAGAHRLHGRLDVFRTRSV